MDYLKLTDYKLQEDYVDKLTDDQKLSLFRSLYYEIQDIADKVWNSEENYSEEFMINWITTDYSKVIANIIDTDGFEYDEDHTIDVMFSEEFGDFKQYEDIANYFDEDEDDFKEMRELSFNCPSFFLDVPEEFLYKWAIDVYIEPNHVKFIEVIGVNG